MGLGQRNCTCYRGYIGDGFNCRGNTYNVSHMTSWPPPDRPLQTPLPPTQQKLCCLSVLQEVHQQPENSFFRVMFSVSHVEIIKTLTAVTSDAVILMPELASRCANVPPKQVPPWHYFAAAPLLHPGLSATQDVCDWFKKMQTRQALFSPMSQTFLRRWALWRQVWLCKTTANAAKHFLLLQLHNKNIELIK